MGSLGGMVVLIRNSLIFFTDFRGATAVCIPGGGNAAWRADLECCMLV
jgi:hypothetical protein